MPVKRRRHGVLVTSPRHSLSVSPAANPWIPQGVMGALQEGCHSRAVFPLHTSRAPPGVSLPSRSRASNVVVYTASTGPCAPADRSLTRTRAGSSPGSPSRAVRWSGPAYTPPSEGRSRIISTDTYDTLSCSLFHTHTTPPLCSPSLSRSISLSLSAYSVVPLGGAGGAGGGGACS